MFKTRRDFLLAAGAVASLSQLVPGAAMAAFGGATSNHHDGLETAYRKAFADFEEAIRPLSELYWESHNRAVADIFAREAALRAVSAA